MWNENRTTRKCTSVYIVRRHKGINCKEKKANVNIIQLKQFEFFINSGIKKNSKWCFTIGHTSVIPAYISTVIYRFFIRVVVEPSYVNINVLFYVLDFTYLQDILYVMPQSRRVRTRQVMNRLYLSMGGFESYDVQVLSKYGWIWKLWCTGSI